MHERLSDTIRSYQEDSDNLRTALREKSLLDRVLAHLDRGQRLRGQEKRRPRYRSKKKKQKNVSMDYANFAEDLKSKSR